jgi:hypothetical protein
MSSSGNFSSELLFPHGINLALHLSVTQHIQCFHVTILSSSLAPPPSKHLQPLTSTTDQGQGGAQAIEDGCALGLLFTNFSATDATSISSRLDSFENVRRNRASAMQMFSNAGQDEAEKIRESALPYVKDGKVPCKYSFDERGKTGKKC